VNVVTNHRVKLRAAGIIPRSLPLEDGPVIAALISLDVGVSS
jgi:hypothetical protein